MDQVHNKSMLEPQKRQLQRQRQLLCIWSFSLALQWQLRLIGRTRRKSIFRHQNQTKTRPNHRRRHTHAWKQINSAYIPHAQIHTHTLLALGENDDVCIYDTIRAPNKIQAWECFICCYGLLVRQKRRRQHSPHWNGKVHKIPRRNQTWANSTHHSAHGNESNESNGARQRDRDREWEGK